MKSLPKQLPDGIDILKVLLSEQAARNAQLDQENARLGAKVLSLQEQLNLALARRYAASSEKLSPDQIRLFDEAEVEAHAEPVEDETVIVPEHNRRKRGRKKIPDSLFRPAPPLASIVYPVVDPLCSPRRVLSCQLPGVTVCKRVTQFTDAK